MMWNLKQIIPALVSLFLIHVRCVENFLSEGKKLLAAGQYMEALRSFDQALKGDSNSYLPYFYRATTYEIVGRFDDAIGDLSQVVKKKPDFDKARLNLGSLLVKLGKYDKAIEELSLLKGDSQSLEMIGKAEEAKKKYQESLDLIKSNVAIEKAVEALDVVIEVSPTFFDAVYKRAECLIKLGSIERASFDLRRASRLDPLNVKVLLQLAEVLFYQGEHDDGLSSVAKCIQMNEDMKACRKLYKSIKANEKILERALGETSKTRKHIQEVIPDVIEVIESASKPVNPGLGEGSTFSLSQKKRASKFLCESQVKLKNTVSAIKYCNLALSLFGDEVELLMKLGDAHILEEKYEAALQAYSKAREIDPSNGQVVEGLQRIQKLIKSASRKDYYKVLDVPKTATQADIKKAYRKMAQLHHPDRVDASQLEETQKKMAEINEAYEVLGNEETRQKYDLGDDPNDPYRGQQGGGNPFQGFNPFGGGGGGFRFHQQQGGGGGFPGGGGFQFHFDL